MKKTNKEQELLQYIREYLKNNGYPPTVREMCRAIKVSSTSTISYYLTKLQNNGLIKKNPNKNRALELVGETCSYENVMSKMSENNFTAIPILGSIAAGEPILAIENCEEYFMTSPNVFKGENLFMLHICGDSMINAGIYNGDQVILRQQTTASNGEIVAAMVDGMATLKRFYKEDGLYRLQPENDSMQSIYTDKVDILGKLVGLVRKF